MTIALVSFGVSLVGILSMILAKFSELKSGKRIFAFFEKTDSALNRFSLKMKRFFHYFNAKTANALFHFFLEITEEFFIAIWKKIYKKLSVIIDMVKGKGIKKDKGAIAVSFFLTDIDRHKEELRKNKI